MANKTALILGGTGGVGQALIKSLTKSYDVYAVYYQNQEKAKELSSMATLIQCDITDELQVQNLAKDVKDLSLLINCSMPKLVLKKFEQHSQDEFNLFFDVLVKGSANIYRSFLKELKKQESIIVDFSSVVAIDPPVDRMCSYAVAKAAQQKLHEYIAEECKNSSIRFFNLVPSFIETQALGVFPAKLLEFQKINLPGEKFIQPEDIAELILRIISNNKKYPQSRNFILRNNEEVISA